MDTEKLLKSLISRALNSGKCLASEVNIWVWGLSLGRLLKTSSGAWLVTVAKKLHETEVQGKSTTLGIGRPGSPREGWSCFGSLWCPTWPTEGPGRKENRSPVCADGAKGILDLQKGCYPAYVFWIEVNPKSGQFKRGRFKLVEMSL